MSMGDRIARLLVTNECMKNCAGCCNKDRSTPPIIKRWDYDMYLLTGGEPMLFPWKVKILIDILYQNARAIRKPLTKIIVCTALTKGLHDIADRCDGVTLTIHDGHDRDNFVKWQANHTHWLNGYKGSLRLNVFKGFLPPLIHGAFHVKPDIEWIPNRPVPRGEDFVRLEEPWRLTETYLKKV
jgi:hypothetical protein